jgi:outer membrane scaffolding protein for murein synthesis (MipA/OmpV family)
MKSSMPWWSSWMPHDAKRAAARAIAVLCLLAPPAAFAQSTAEIPEWIGLGVRTRPAYDGSASQRAELIPTVRYFGRPWFARTTQGILEGGARLELTSALHAGAQLAYEGGRLASESGFLRDHNVQDIDPGASAGVHLEWDHDFGPMPTTTLVRYRQNVDPDRGAQADLRVTGGILASGPVLAALFFQATWADARSNQSFYGITAGQSATTGLPEFSPGSGLLFASAGLLWEADFSRHWIAVGSAEARHLEGDAAHSPLAERTTNYYASASIAYRF